MRGRMLGRHLAVLMLPKRVPPGASDLNPGHCELRESTNLAQNAHSCLHTSFLSISVLKTAQPRPGGYDWRAREWGQKQEVGTSVTPMPWPLFVAPRPPPGSLKEGNLKNPKDADSHVFSDRPSLFTAAVLATWDGISEAASTFLGPPTWFP